MLFPCQIVRPPVLHSTCVAKAKRIAHHPTLARSLDSRSDGCCRHFLLACTSALGLPPSASSERGRQQAWLHTQAREGRKRGPRGKIHPISPCPRARSLTSALLLPSQSLLVPFASSSQRRELAAMPIPNTSACWLACNIAYLFGIWACVSSEGLYYSIASSF